MILDLYYWLIFNGWKVSIMFEEIEIFYNLIFVNIMVGDQFKLEFFKISFNNKIFVIVDNSGFDGNLILIFELGVILFYLVEKIGCFFLGNLGDCYIII